MDINVRIEGIDELRAAVEAMTAAILANKPITAEPAAGKAQAKPVKAAPQPEPTPEPEPIPAVPVVDKDQLRAKFAEVARRGMRKQLKELLTMFGAENVSSLPEDKLNQVESVLDGLLKGAK